MSAEQAIRQVIEAQCSAWNNTDILGFVEHVHPDVIYVTAHGLVQGKEQLLNAYRGDWRSKGGQLTVSLEQVLDHGGAATAVVQYWLTGGTDDRSGWSLLTFRRTDQGWKLIADATLRHTEP